MPSNLKIVLFVVIFLLIFSSAGAAAYFMFFDKKDVDIELVASVPEVEVSNTPVPASAPEPDSTGISPDVPKVIPQKPPAVIEKEGKKVETVETETTKTAPSNNKKPEVNILSYGLADWNHDSDKGVSISARAKDSDGYISKVEIYVDGDKKATVLPRNIGGKSKTLLDDPEDIVDITEQIGNDIQDEVDDGDIKYIYRKSKEWSKESESCGISQGFVHIFVGESKFYDVRTSEDLDESVICFESETMNVDDLYYYMWQPDGGSHDTYAIAYDQYGASTKSDKVEFDVD
ncbi:hypothetical protein CO058_01975 [candidate division WWE3 bacterium CG_4_9_14_0_2_um_filter_35_11]|uniref:Uncharacterized protein n=1 Tax=candidate division WWE3 bacterium CG_4_9_14_0_2_um_filter_35_11 TaxID=1975077 RepID=A0A2M8ELX7_UNCKA|nr:MAG: hypothetical protein COV25_00990 [candidate division WWE3 bacterium CG10_big_fil_rev_8_21_14_0_10_35_32]PJC23744.1 MAG: hypothetical protein CO058_01975 [candidate division WWE3 bacterium CG_4_9_14_0_2_um_filter_35_11]